MQDDSTGFVMVGIIIGTMLASMFWGIAWSIKGDATTTTAIENGCASYDSKTGKFQWHRAKGDSND